ncbi:MAG: hypothetical protein QOI21_3393 [Actinomycetota bacterium]|jgi:hypothetical protein|nr:hypothetical protein [Actinomycetota bacterium]
MRCIAKFVGAGLVLFAATACAGQGSPTAQPAGQPEPSASAGVAPPSDIATPTPGRPKQVVPEGTTEVPAGQIDSSALPADYPRDVTTSNGGTVLSIRAQEGGCGRVSAAPVEQTSQRVVVNLTETTAQTNQICTMDIRTPVVSATLDAPLAARTVVLTIETR